MEESVLIFMFPVSCTVFVSQKMYETFFVVNSYWIFVWLGEGCGAKVRFTIISYLADCCNCWWQWSLVDVSFSIAHMNWYIFKSRWSRCSLVDGGGCTQVVEVSCLGFWCLMDPGVVRFLCCCLYWWRMKNSIQSLYCTYCIAENRHFGCSREEPRAWPTQNCLLFFFWWNHPESWGSIVHVNTFVTG